MDGDSWRSFKQFDYKPKNIKCYSFASINFIQNNILKQTNKTMFLFETRIKTGSYNKFHNSCKKLSLANIEQFVWIPAGKYYE